MGLIDQLCKLVDWYPDEGNEATTNLVGFGEKKISVEKDGICCC